MKTYSAKPSEVDRRWYVVDADGEVLGRMATRIATVLRGKHKPMFTPHIDTGDFVVVLNASKVRLTGDKLNKKQYYRHSGYPGGLTSMPYAKLLRTHPERAIERAVWGMLPKTSLGRRQLRKLKVYAGAGHPHGAQNPKPLAEGLTDPAGFAPAIERKRKERPKKEAARKAPPAKKDDKAAKAPSKKKPAARKPAEAKKKAAAAKPKAKDSKEE